MWPNRLDLVWLSASTCLFPVPKRQIYSSVYDKRWRTLCVCVCVCVWLDIAYLPMLPGKRKLSWPILYETNSVMSNQNWYLEDFLESFIWSFIDHSKDNFRNNYLIFKPNYFIFFLLNNYFFFLINFLNNYLQPFLITP